jgi:predicted dehydrogenase
MAAGTGLWPIVNRGNNIRSPNRWIAPSSWRGDPGYHGRRPGWPQGRPSLDDDSVTVKRLAIGIVGLGGIGRVHAYNAVYRTGLCDLTRVVDAVEQTARRTAESLGVAWSSSYDDLLNDDRISAVVIATPTPTHAEMIERAARAGKHVFCEKPLSLEFNAGKRAVTAARSAGVSLQVGFQRRFDPDWRHAKLRIERGDLGHVYLLRSSLRDAHPPSVPDYVNTVGDLLADSVIHDLDAARWLLGEVEEVSVHGASLSDPIFRSLGDVDNVLVVLQFVSGALGVIDASRVAGYGYECSTEVMGSQATIRIGYGHRSRHVELLRTGGLEVPLPADNVERHSDAYLLELQDFIRTVLSGEEPRVTGDDAVAAFRLVEATRLSLRGRRRVDLPAFNPPHRGGSNGRRRLQSRHR